MVIVGEKEMGYGRRGWFKSYITMMKNSFQYASNSTTKHKHWIARAFALMFSIIWYIVTIAIFVIIPLVPIILLLIMLL